MACAFSQIYELFLNQVPDREFTSLDDFTKEYLMEKYLSLAQAKFARICNKNSGINLSDRDELKKQYNADLSLEIIDVLVYGMIWARTCSKTNHGDNMKNHLNSKDLALASSPANMLKELRQLKNDAWIDFNRAIKLYSYGFCDATSLK